MQDCSGATGDPEVVRAVLDQVEAWHDRNHRTVGGTFARCFQDPCANVLRAARGLGQRHGSEDCHGR